LHTVERGGNFTERTVAEMLPSIETATRALWKTDPSITPEQAQAAMDALTGQTVAGLAVPVPIDRALTRQQVAEMLAVKPHTVSDYARKGLIKAFRFGAKGKLASGYSAESVRALLSGMVSADGGAK